MRVAVVCSDLGQRHVLGHGAALRWTATGWAAAGHEVWTTVPVPLADRGGLRPLPAGPATATSFTGRQRDAELARDALVALHRRAPLDLVLACGAGDGSAAVRAKRLLGELAAVPLAVTLEPWADVPPRPGAPAPLDAADRTSARDYCTAHADLVVSCSPVAARCRAVGAERLRLVSPGPVPDLGPGPPGSPAAARTVWHWGDLSPGSDAGTFAMAVGLVLAEDPAFRFVLVPGEPPGAGWPAAERLRRRLRPGDRRAVRLRPALSLAALSAGAAAGQCVLSGGLRASPVGALLARAAGLTVVARAGSAAGEVVARDGTGALVTPGNAEELAAVLLAGATTAGHLGWRVESPAGGGTAPAGRRGWPVEARAGGAAAPCGARPEDLVRGMRPTAARTPAPRRGPVPVSVVIAVRDEVRYLPAAVDSVRAEDASAEVVVVDDGSTASGARAAIDSLDGVVVVRAPPAGLSAARNAGIARATRRYVLPLDADDELARGFLAPAVAALDRHPELAYLDCHVEQFGLVDQVLVPLGHVGDLSLLVNTFGRATGLYRRSSLEAVGGYDVTLAAYEDWDLHLRLRAAGFLSEVLPLVGHRYRRHRDSMTFRATADLRAAAFEDLLARHLAGLPADRAAALTLAVALLWKARYEPSASVRLLVSPDATGGVRGDRPGG